MIIKQGGVVAYPTESCFGLGCDPHNLNAIRRILKIKRRSRSKGLILVSDHYFRFKPFVKGIPEEFRSMIFSSWPGPNTWLLPAKQNLSRWLRGDFDTLAVRVDRHRLVRALCRSSRLAIVSTSANKAGRPSLKCFTEVKRQLGNEVDYILPGRIGISKSPSVIRHAQTGQLVRG